MGDGWSSFLAVVLSVVVATPASGAATTVGRDDEPETITVERGPFTVELELSGAFDEPDAVEVKYRPQVSKGELEIAEVAEPGEVREGQLLVRFDAEKIDEQIEQAQIDLKIARTSAERLAQELSHKEEAAAIQLESARMAHEKAARALETFRDVLMPIQLAEAELSLQGSKDRLKEEEEQFVQLEKMYKSDDLVEETEDIVLNRARRALERSREQMKFTLRRHELRTTVDIPRELKDHEFSLRKAANAWELAQATSRLAVDQSLTEMRKSQLALERQEEQLQKLLEDRAALTITATRAGLAVPGQLARGKWTKLAPTPGGLAVGDKVSANQVLFSIVQWGPAVVRTTVPEASVLDVEVGQAATVTPAATPDSSLAAEITRVARVSADGNFEVWLRVAEPDERLIAGNGCSIRLTTLSVPDAIAVPIGAVTRDGDRTLVHVWKDGEAQPQEVKLGRSSDARVQILSGLSVGDRVLKTAGASGTK